MRVAAVHIDGRKVRLPAQTEVDAQTRAQPDLVFGVQRKIRGDLILLGEVALNERADAAQQKIHRRIVGELPVKRISRVLLSRNLEIRGAPHHIHSECELVASAHQAEIVGELERCAVDMSQRAGTAERAEVGAHHELRKIAWRRRHIEPDVARSR